MATFPKPPRKHWYKRAWVWLLITVALLISLGVIGKAMLGSLTPTTEAADQAVTVAVRDLTKAITSTGKIAPEHSEGVSFAVPARITDILVKPGDEVEKDAVLVKSNLGNLKAPFDGRVLTVTTFVGDTVVPGVAVVEVGYRTNFVDFIATESEIIDTQIGQAVELTIPSYTNGSDRYAGTVERIEIVKTTSTATLAGQASSAETGYLVRIRPSDLPDTVKNFIGLTVNISVTVDTKPAAVSVERAAVQYRDDGSAYVLLENGEEQTVATGFAGDDYIELLSGATDGDTVLLDIPEVEAQSFF